VCLFEGRILIEEYGISTRDPKDILLPKYFLGSKGKGGKCPPRFPP